MEKTGGDRSCRRALLASHAASCLIMESYVASLVHRPRTSAEMTGHPGGLDAVAAASLGACLLDWIGWPVQSKAGLA
jgi:hypothetical protein